MRRIALLALTTAVAACGSSDADDEEDLGLACVMAMRGETYTVGLEHTGDAGQLDFKLMSAAPSPPGRDDNVWVLQINQMASGVVGAPATGATMTVTPFMPDHGHHAAVPVKIEAMPDAGQYKLNPVNMWMPGLWEVTIEAQAGAASDTTVYRFCIQA